MRILKFLPLAFIIGICFSSCEDDPEQLMNVVPVADAGPVKMVTLPATITLTGTGTDADGTVKAYLWSQVSGPAPSIITNPGNTSTNIKFTVDGSYIFQLMVTDNMGATGVDTTTVIVNPAPLTTLTLQPANNPNERLIVSVGGVDQSVSNNVEWVIDAWTVGGNAYYGREAVKFDLSTIPASATIESANLYLYSDSPPQNGNLVDANFGTDNSMVLQRIIADWTPSTTNWNNQPATTPIDQIIIPHTSSSVLDLNIDVKKLVASMVNNNTNYGFFLRLQTEVAFRSRMFVSSNHPTKADKRPKLVVVYHL